MDADLEAELAVEIELQTKSQTSYSFDDLPDTAFLVNNNNNIPQHTNLTIINHQQHNSSIPQPQRIMDDVDNPFSQEDILEELGVEGQMELESQLYTEMDLDQEIQSTKINRNIKNHIQQTVTIDNCSLQKQKDDRKEGEKQEITEDIQPVDEMTAFFEQRSYHALQLAPLFGDYITISRSDDPLKLGSKLCLRTFEEKELNDLSKRFHPSKRKQRGSRKRRKRHQGLLERPITEMILDIHQNNHSEESNQKVSTDFISEQCLWVNKYSPSSFIDLLSDSRVNRELLSWLKSWESIVFGKRSTATQPESAIALLVGFPGSGKSTLAHFLAKQSGYNVLEVNASDDRSAVRISKILKDATESSRSLKNNKPNCLILDEIDGSVTGDEGSAVNALISFVKTTKRKYNSFLRPVICIANDLYSKNMKPFRQADQNLVQIFRMEKPRKDSVAARLLEICKHESIRSDFGTMQTIAGMANSDVRTALNYLQMFLSGNMEKATIRKHNLSLTGFKDGSADVFSCWNQLFRRITSKVDAPGNSKLGVVSDMIEKSECGGDRTLLLDGAFENYLTIGYQDTNLKKTSYAIEMLGLASTNRGNKFSSTFISSLNMYCGTKHPNTVKFPQKANRVLQTKNRNRNIVRAFINGSAAAVTNGWNSRNVILDVIPMLLEIITPQTHRFKQLSSGEFGVGDSKSYIKNLVSLLLSLGITFRRCTLASSEMHGVNDIKYQMVPEINLLRVSESLKRDDLSDDIKRNLAHEVEMESLRRRGGSIDSDTTSASEESKKPAKKVQTEPKVQKREQKKSQSSKRTLLQTLCFGGQPKRRRLQKQARVNKGVQFRYHEGFTNAVRRPLSVRCFLSE